MNEITYNTLTKALAQYGKSEGIILKKQDLATWEKNTAEEIIEVPDFDYLRLREFLMLNGRIFEETIEKLSYCAVLKFGYKKSNEAFVVILRESEKIYIGAYSKEGLINQHLSKKAVDIVKEEILKISGKS
jgi:hypothetical protein